MSRTLLYVGCYTNWSAVGIRVFDATDPDGRLVALAEVDGLEHPSFLAVHPSRHRALRRQRDGDVRRSRQRRDRRPADRSCRRVADAVRPCAESRCRPVSPEPRSRRPLPLRRQLRLRDGRGRRADARRRVRRAVRRLPARGVRADESADRTARPLCRPGPGRRLGVRRGSRHRRDRALPTRCHRRRAAAATRAADDGSRVGPTPPRVPPALADRVRGRRARLHDPRPRLRRPRKARQDRLAADAACRVRG